MHSKEALSLIPKVFAARDVPIAAATREIVSLQNIEIHGQEHIEAGREWLNQNGKLLIFTNPHTSMYDGPIIQDKIIKQLFQPSYENCKWLVSIKNFRFWEVKELLKKHEVDFNLFDYWQFVPSTRFKAATRQYALQEHFERLPVIQQYLQTEMKRERSPYSTKKIDSFIKTINNASISSVRSFARDQSQAGIVATFSEGTRSNTGSLGRAERGIEVCLAYRNVRALCVRLDYVDAISERKSPLSIGPHTHRDIHVHVHELIDHQKLRQLTKQYRLKHPKTEDDEFSYADALMVYTAGDDLPVRIPGVDPYGAYSDKFIERVPENEEMQTVVFEAK